MGRTADSSDIGVMRKALALARRGYGTTSPNPMVGAVLVKGNKILGRGWHRRAGGAHAEVQALRDAERRGHDVKEATIYVTLEPCCTHGRTPPCTDAIIGAQLKRVVVAAIDPNPAHCRRGLRLLQRAGLDVAQGVLEHEALELNEDFNHWIVRRTPYITVKAAMTLDGKIATATGESKWITGARARAFGMRLRQGADALLAGVNTVLADDPALTARRSGTKKQPRRIILDANARTPLKAKVVCDSFASMTSIVVSKAAPPARVAALRGRVNVIVAPSKKGCIDLPWLLKRLGSEEVTSLLVEGGGEVNASFLLQRLAHRIAFFYAPKILGGRDSIKSVAGNGLMTQRDWIRLAGIKWRALGPDLLLTALTGV